MIVDKNPKENVPDISDPIVGTFQEPDIPEALRGNAMVGAYEAMREILLTIRENPDDPNSPPFFKTIKLDNGQLSRIKNNSHNLEYGIVFPAVFIHYIDVYYNVGAGRVMDGRGVMRIHYVLNRLNNGDDGEQGELEGLILHDRITEAVETHKNKFPALVNRFQLQYWDQPLTFDDALQPYWIDYQIWFSDYTTYRYKNYQGVYVTVPPFTQHSDQNEIANSEGLPNDTEPRFEDVASFGENK